MNLCGNRAIYPPSHKLGREQKFGFSGKLLDLAAGLYEYFVQVGGKEVGQFEEPAESVA